MTRVGAGAARGRPTGGASPHRASAKAWFVDLTAHLGRVLDRAAAADALRRPPAVRVVGVDAQRWERWLHAQGTVLAGPERRADVVVCLDAFAGRPVRALREDFGRLHAASAPGARLVVVERVVRTSGAPALAIGDLLAQLGTGTGSAMTLHDLRSLARPGEPHRSTVLLELLRLGRPQETA